MDTRGRMGLEEEIVAAKRIAVEAGRLQLSERQKPLETIIKEDNSPCTRVDRLCSEFISGELRRAFPNYQIIDEEAKKSGLPQKKDYVWVVDPLESTISYMRDADTFGVMIGLLKAGIPVLGVTYRPRIDELVYASSGDGAYLKRGNAVGRIRTEESEDMRLLLSMFRGDQKTDELVLELNPAEVRRMPSSFKTIEVAKGDATAFISTKQTTMNIWDLCAPQAILEEAGGKMTDLYGKPIDYTEGYTNLQGVVASNSALHRRIIACTSEMFK